MFDPSSIYVRSMINIFFKKKFFLMNERDLKKKLHSTLISKAKINDICEDLQDKYTEQANQYNQTLSLLNELLEIGRAHV